MRKVWLSGIVGLGLVFLTIILSWAQEITESSPKVVDRPLGASAAVLPNRVINPHCSRVAPQTAVGVECARIAQASQPGAAEHRAEFGREFKLRNGEAASVSSEGLALRFERVTRDDRCPAGDPCVGGVGDARVLVTVQQPPHEAAARELHTHPSSISEGQYLRYRVRLIRLEPRPTGEQQVPLPQYWATFLVSR